MTPKRWRSCTVACGATVSGSSIGSSPAARATPMLSTAPSAAQSARSRGSASEMGRGGGAVVLSPRARQVLFAQPAFRHLGAAARTQALGFFHEVALGKDETVYRAGDDADA